MINNFSNDSTKDHQVPILIDDTIQSLQFFPKADLNYFASCGWDGKLRIFEIKNNIVSTSTNNDKVNINTNLISQFQFKSPILSLSWKGDSGNIFTGCCDGSINYVEFQKNSLTKIGEHQYGCREVIYLDNFNLLISGGWDGLLKLWDLRTPNVPISTYQFANKIYTMSYSKNLLVIGLSENNISYFNLDKLQKAKFEPELIYQSLLKCQIKKVAALRDGNGYVEGNSEGRVLVKYLNLYNPNFDKINNQIKSEKDFSFKFHRELRDNIIYAYNVNDISVNPIYGSICVVGGDGKYSIIDLDKKTKIYERKNYEDKTPLTACDYNLKGDLLVYASGYDWSKGAKFAHLYSRPKIFVHYLQNSQRKKIGL